MKKLFKLIGILIAKYGDNILIKPTMRCQLSCDYCIVNKTLGHRPVFKEVCFTQWLGLLRIRKPKTVTISGGSPEMYPNIEHIINYLTKKQVFVTIQTNLMKLNLNIKPSRYLWFYTTYHKQNKQLFLRNLDIYRAKGFNISVAEFGKQEIPGSHKKLMRHRQTISKIECYAPDLSKHNSWIEMEQNG